MSVDLRTRYLGSSWRTRSSLGLAADRLARQPEAAAGRRHRCGGPEVAVRGEIEHEEMSASNLMDYGAELSPERRASSPR